MNLLNRLPQDERDLIVNHLRLVIEANRTVNLTRIDSFEEGLVLHIEDSLSVLPELEGAPQGRYADLGSGGGFPGIPLAIATKRDTTLIDARKKKTIALENMIESLGIGSYVKTYAGRAELLARKEPHSFSVITARAVSQLSVLMELSSPLLKKGGQLICMKAHVSTEEKDHAQQVENATGMHLVSSREFLLDDSIQRTVLVYQKRGKPTVRLPRLEGQAQKNPL